MSYRLIDVEIVAIDGEWYVSMGVGLRTLTTPQPWPSKARAAEVAQEIASAMRQNTVTIGRIVMKEASK